MLLEFKLYLQSLKSYWNQDGSIPRSDAGNWFF